jgi:oxalate decarboxylase/phosphoglucose isomerase-like protein (cupin superfamily)
MSFTATHDQLDIGGDQVTFRCTSEQSGGNVLAIEVVIPPGGGPPMLHRHDPFELYRLEEGELTFYVADENGAVRASRAVPGDVVCIPGGREHTVRNESGQEARAFTVFSPGAGMERFMRAAGRLESPDMDDVLELASAHGVEITRAVS